MITQTDALGEAEHGDVIVRVDGCSGTIAVNRKDKRNALSRSMLKQMLQAFQDLHREKRVRAVILTGTGSTFSAGTDLREMHVAMREGDAHTIWHQDCAAQQALIETMLRFPKPIVAALNGPAFGFGASLVLACDFAVGTSSALFGFPEVKLGLVSGLAAPLLAFRIGTAGASDLLLRGQPLDADRCHQLGIYRWLVSEDLVWAKADATARELATSAPEAVAMSKRILNETLGEQLLTHLASGAAATATARTTEAAVEGVAAFVEKREPQWP